MTEEEKELALRQIIFSMSVEGLDLTDDEIAAVRRVLDESAAADEEIEKIKKRKLSDS